jgi:hypothetical protein
LVVRASAAGSAALAAATAAVKAAAADSARGRGEFGLKGFSKGGTGSGLPEAATAVAADDSANRKVDTGRLLSSGLVTVLSLGNNEGRNA